MDKEQVLKFIFNPATNILKVQDFLESYPNLDPRQFVNQQKSNIIHHLSFYDNQDIIKLYINHTARLIKTQIQQKPKLYEKNVSQQIGVWINEKNIQGFTPILYAAFNGHVALIKYLEELGANIHAVNQTKLNVLHMAAQNNKVSTFIHFSDKISLNERDSKGNTPLHWAAYSGSEDVVAYILSQNNIAIDAKDQLGQTPLLLATIYGNTKIVRRLLIKGASRHIKNDQGLLPIQSARQSQFKNIYKMLDNDYSICDLFKFYYNMKLQYKPKKRSLVIPIVFIITTLCALLIIHGLIEFKDLIVYIEGGVVLLMMLLYFSLLFPPKKNQQQSPLKYINQTRKYCFDCKHKKLKRSYHCDICGVCIEQYDHHCTWINNCVGKKNIARFILFLFLLVLCLCFVGIVSTLNWLILITPLNNPLPDYFHFRKAYVEQPYAKIIRAALLAVDIIISTFFFPVLLLFLVQIKNLFLNKTTYQRIRGNNTSVKEQLKGKNKNGGYMKNCKTMCSNTRGSVSSASQSLQQDLLSE